MTTLKTVRPSGSYLIELPDDIVEQYDRRVSSFWLDEKPLLLQLSSYVRAEGVQLAARDRIEERMAKHARNWKIWGQNIYPDSSVDQATAEFLDENGVLWTHTYLVWPHLTIYVTVSGPEAEVRKSDSWAMDAVRRLKLAIH